MEILDGVKQTFNERIKGAFGGTFIIVWAAINWRLLFVLINFDNTHTLNDKQKIVGDYVKGNYPAQLLIYPIVFSLISVLVFSILNAITLYIVSFFKLRIKPHILKKSGSKDIVEMSRFNAVEKEYEKIKNRYNREQSEFFNSINEKESLKLELESTKGNLKAQTDRIDMLIKDSDTALTETRKSYEEQIKLLKKQNDSVREQYRDSQGNFRQQIFPHLMFLGEWEKISTKDGTQISEKVVVERNEMTLINDVEARIFPIENMSEVNTGFIEISLRDLQTNKLRLERLTIVTDKFYVGADDMNNYIEYRRKIN